VVKREEPLDIAARAPNLVGHSAARRAMRSCVAAKHGAVVVYGASLLVTPRPAMRPKAVPKVSALQQYLRKENEKKAKKKLMHFFV